MQCDTHISLKCQRKKEKCRKKNINYMIKKLKIANKNIIRLDFERKLSYIFVPVT